MELVWNLLEFDPLFLKIIWLLSSDLTTLFLFVLLQKLTLSLLLKI